MRVLLTFAVAALALPACSSPQWLRDSETCNGWYRAWTDGAIGDMKDSPFVIGVPLDREIIEKAHKQGTRVLAYVTFYQAPPNEIYQGAKLADHPDWYVIKPDGSIGISCFEGTENTGWKTVCPNSPGFRDHVLKLCKSIMDLGVDGLFIDNGHPDVVCEAPKFDRHKHIYPGKDNVYAYRKLLESVRALLKGYGEDRVMFVNPGSPNEQWVGACDGQMIESYICTWAAKNRWHNQRQILDFQRRYGPMAEGGHTLIALSYIGHTPNPPREDAFYCYAWARLSGFTWADWFTAKDSARCLYKLRLGKPTGQMKSADNVFCREFERGVVAASDESQPGTLRISGRGHPRVFDVFGGRHLTPGPSGDYEVSLGKGEGRVYLFD